MIFLVKDNSNILQNAELEWLNYCVKKTFKERKCNPTLLVFFLHLFPEISLSGESFLTSPNIYSSEKEKGNRMHDYKQTKMQYQRIS